MKKKGIWIIAFIVLLIAGAQHVFFIKKQRAGLLPLKVQTPEVIIGTTHIPVTVADDPIEREQGLSNTPFLKANTGKLFIFESSSRPGFWMKDMQYSIDIIWISPDWHIVDITERATPESYPTLFFPREDVQYVLEVNAGFAKANDITIGQSVVFKK